MSEPLALEEIDDALRERALVRRVLGTPDGLVLLSLIRRKCGVESADPKTIVPELVGFCNWLHQEAGIFHPRNLYNVTAALMGVADDEDLLAERKALGAEEDS